MFARVYLYARRRWWWGIRMLKPHLSEWPRTHSSFQIRSFVKAVATDTLKEPLLLHQGGSKINEALPEDRERKAA